MKIKEIRTRTVQWRGKTVPLPPHFCTNPMDLLSLPEASMQTFTFHGFRFRVLRRHRNRITVLRITPLARKPSIMKAR